MADFRETVQEHIGGMSASELAATEARRRQREAGNGSRLVLEARWDPAPGAPAKEPVTKEVTIEIEQPAAPGGDGILRIFEGPAFKETLLLTPALYRLIAGGKTLDSAEEDRFFIGDGSGGPDKISVDRAALAVMLRDFHPREMNRAARLIAAEPPGPIKSGETLQKLADDFARNWAKDIIHDAVEQLVAKVPSRTLHLIVGKDHVSLTVRKEELLVGDGGLFKSPLAAAIVRPKDTPIRAAILVAGDPAAFRDRDAPFLKNTFGTGAARRLVLDVVKLKDVATGLAPEHREAALALLSKLIERAAALNREQPARPPVPVHPVAPVKRNRQAPPPPAPAVTVEGTAMTGPDVNGITMEPDGGLEDGCNETEITAAAGGDRHSAAGAEAIEDDAQVISPLEANEPVANLSLDVDEDSMDLVIENHPSGAKAGALDDIEATREMETGAVEEAPSALMGEMMEDLPALEAPDESELVAAPGDIKDIDIEG